MSSENEESRGWFARLKTGLDRSSRRLADGIAALVGGGKLDDTAIEGIEELLIGADTGVATANALAAELRRHRFTGPVDDRAVREALAEAIAHKLEPMARPLVLDPSHRPHVVLMCGVNGSGKTTTAAKLAHRFLAEGRRPMLVAADTFRAAATEQLAIWAERIGVPLAKAEAGSDPAALAYQALERARAEGVDVLLVDTAGRLQNKANLMAELEKIVRVLRKLDASAPHSVVLVLDATVGQNALQQAKVFGEAVQVTGLAMTKLDGTARGGILLALTDAFGLPVHAIGIGEGVGDLQPFEARAFARALLGLAD